MEILNTTQQQFISQCRDYIEQMNYEPLTDAELLDVQNNEKEAADNNRLEGLYDDELDILLDALFIEYRLPPESRVEVLVAAYREIDD